MPLYDYFCKCGEIVRDVVKPMRLSSSHKCPKCKKGMKRLLDQQNNSVSIPKTFGHWIDQHAPVKSKEEIQSKRKRVPYGDK